MHPIAPSAPVVPLAPELLPEMSDNQVLDDVARGHPERFAIIVRRYNVELYRVGMAYLRNHAQAEDAMQNTYLKAFMGLRRFQRSAAFATWLTRIMINECLMILRSQMRFRTESLDEATTSVRLETLPSSTIDPIHAREMTALLERALQVLSPVHRAVYLSREIQHRSTAETASRLGLSEENVKVSLHRARAALRATLRKRAERVELLDYPATFCGPMTADVMRAVLSAQIAMMTEGGRASE
ncbi:MAG TPA: sigma-70 family RNA polymerase sigma factor [Opitutaceae bacterium]|nr:sigma-70 family RNA polymerase sigma factor [Opitutaceae bacterium]